MCKGGQLWQTAPVRKDAPQPAPATSPNWRDFKAFNSQDLPHRVRSWLLDKGSLTERLIGASGGDFEVLRLSQGWQLPTLSERNLLDIPSRQWALVREVVLRCHGQAWVYARSVIPGTTLSGSLRYLRWLENQSLGALIFQNPQLRRSSFQLALLPANCDYIHASLRQQAPAWARRSRFTIAGKSLSVSEVFLQQFQP
jgi:chorismate--pyruvate lyase